MDESTQRRNRLRTSPMGTIRFLAYPWSQMITEEARKTAQPYHGQPLAALEGLLDTRILPTMLELSRPQHDEISSTLYVRTLYCMRQESLCYGAFVATGSETFSFSEGLAQELRCTDIAEARIEQLQLPYPAFFMHFGPQEGIEINDDQRVTPEVFDGAFVWRLEDGTLNLSLTFGRAGGRSSSLSGPTCQITPAMLSLPANVAVRQGLEEAAHESLEQQRRMLSSPDVERELKIQEASYSEAVEAATNLVINALFYLSTYRNHGQPAPEPATPVFLQEKFRRARNAKQQRDANNAMLKSGYTVVRMCGSEFLNPSSGAIGAGGQGSGVAMRAHWRRGHWRNQRYGASLAFEKLIWVRPTLVAPGRESIDARVYAVQ